jgi:5-methylcytosine-specific restriction protein A
MPNSKRAAVRGAVGNATRPRSSRVDWTRDELILALDVYFQVAPGTPGPLLPGVRELSALLRSGLFHSGSVKSPNFRSPASVVMKLMNFRSIDPAYKGRGLTGGGDLDRAVWEEFASDRKRLSRVAEAIRTAASTTDNSPPETDEAFEEAEEGAILSRLHRRRERDPRLAKRKKGLALDTHGRLRCEVCDFDFSSTYGELGAGFIECHHRRPLADLPYIRKTLLEDLALLCSNCHRMIHTKRPWLTVDALKEILSQQKGQS